MTKILFLIFFMLLTACDTESKVPKELIGTWNVDSTEYISKYNETYEDLIPINLLEYLKDSKIILTNDSIFTKIYKAQIDTFEKYDDNSKLNLIKNYLIEDRILKYKDFIYYDFTTNIDGFEKVDLIYKTSNVKGIFNFSDGDIIYLNKNNIILTDLVNAYYLSRVK